ncbi:MAG: SAM-dependent methyltransferase [Pigmentiphaga sp.]|nr:SAM-dependent methyltransferase [Pigmentiphaga sp.]
MSAPGRPKRESSVGEDVAKRPEGRPSTAPGHPSTAPRPEGGTLHLLPVGLGEAPPDTWLPAAARAQAGRLRRYIAENAKTARAFLKQVGTESPLQEIDIQVLDRQADEARLRTWLAPLAAGEDIGLVSEAGCPAVADPGAKVVALAHRLGHRVQPWVGPSSILLGLMASGLEGQRFAFHGYAPVKPADRVAQLRHWEQNSRREAQTQILIETPYRNGAMFASLLEHLRPDTRLCVARALTTAEEWVRTLTVAQWRQQPPPALDKQPTLFLFLAD